MVLPLLGLGAIGLTGKLLSKKKDSNSAMYNNLLTSLAPHMKALSDMGGTGMSGANQDYTTAREGYTEALDFYRNILSGDRDNLLKLLDASATTRAYDEQARQNYELAPRGGRRAATAANLEMSKMSELNKLLQYLRGQAPGSIANIASGVSGQASSQQNAALQALASVMGFRLNLEQGNEQIKQTEKDRKNAMIGNIIGSAGSVLGGFLGAK